MACSISIVVHLGLGLELLRQQDLRLAVDERLTHGHSSGDHPAVRIRTQNPHFPALKASGRNANINQCPPLMKEERVTRHRYRLLGLRLGLLHMGLNEESRSPD